MTARELPSAPRPRTSERPASARALLCCALVACTSATAPPPTAAPIEPPSDAIAKTTENGPVKATVQAWPARPTLGDLIYLRVTIDAPAGITIDAPYQNAGDGLGRFKIDSHSRDVRRKPDGGTVETQLYALQAPTSGKHRIPPLRIEMIDARAGAGKETPRAQELLTDELAIQVAPVKLEATNAELKPARGPLDPDVGGVPWLWIFGAISAGAMLVSAAALIVRARRDRRRRAKQRSAYDDALARLARLEARGAPTGDDADAWFVELSSLGRDYIERRFEIRAPELTTEEFLQYLTAHPGAFDERHRGYLEAFLAICDRVKFAGVRPTVDESIHSLAETRRFLDDTRVREPAPGEERRA